MIAKLKEPIEYVQYLGDGSLLEIEDMFDKYGYDTDCEIDEKGRLSLYYKLKENEDWCERNELYLLPGSYIIFHKLLIPHLIKNWGVLFDDFSDGYDFSDIFEA